MFARIVVGILIGFVGGFIKSCGGRLSDNAQQALEALLFLSGLAFIISSFMFGAIYGAMAIAEIAGGYYAFKFFRGKKSMP